MRALIDVKPTSEQLKIVSQNQLGTEVIRGAAGSGKTTTALLRLRSLIGLFTSRRKRSGSGESIRILVLTYNRTLRGYIEELTRAQVADENGISMTVSTFASWAREALGAPQIIDSTAARDFLRSRAPAMKIAPDFVVEEAEYVMGRLLPCDLNDYLTIRREGRGMVPRMERSQREVLLNEVVYPYRNWLSGQGVVDWNDLAVQLAGRSLDSLHDVIIVDESQDFSANEIRAIRNQLAPENCLTLIVDTAQRIYARGFSWAEVGVDVRPERSWRLTRNYRNTVEIARFAAPIIAGLPLDEDATLPDFSSSERHGPVPQLLKGKYSDQCKYAIQHIRDHVDLGDESVAFLHPKGGGWFKYLREQLSEAGLPFVELSRRSDWPQGSENIALSTLHSAKGLEFDHVIILGLSSEITPQEDGDEDGRLMAARRLLAMGVGRAKSSLTIGYKADTASNLIAYFEDGTYHEIEV